MLPPCGHVWKTTTTTTFRFIGNTLKADLSSVFNSCLKCITKYAAPVIPDGGFKSLLLLEKVPFSVEQTLMKWNRATI